MRINKWFGKLNIRIEVRWKKRYRHSSQYVLRRLYKATMLYGTGVTRVEWLKPWQFWKRGWSLKNINKK